MEITPIAQNANTKRSEEENLIGVWVASDGKKNMATKGWK